MVITDENEEVRQYISCQMMLAVQLWMETYHANFDAFDSKLRSLDPENDDDVDLMEWERREELRLSQWMTILDDNPREFDLPDWDVIDNELRDMEVISLPDLPHNEVYGCNASRLMAISTGRVLMKARDSSRRVVAKMIFNRSTVMRDENNPDAPSQSVLNGDHQMSSSWLHNFVCFLVCLTFTSFRRFFFFSVSRSSCIS